MMKKGELLLHRKVGLKGDCGKPQHGGLKRRLRQTAIYKGPISFYVERLRQAARVNPTRGKPQGSSNADAKMNPPSITVVWLVLAALHLPALFSALSIDGGLEARVAPTRQAAREGSERVHAASRERGA